MAPSTPKHAYATLITRSSYLAGVILLAYTLHKHSPSHPLIVLYTPSSLHASCITALESESCHSNLILHPIEPLLPPSSDPKNLIAERFADTWTKLRVFELRSLPYTKICFLDADMLVLHDPSTLFDTELPGDDGILATHVCVCNLDHDPWASPSWTPQNCAYTGLAHPSALTHPTPVTPDTRLEHQLLNSGMFVFAPSGGLCERLMKTFQNAGSETLAAYKFPDQDFLTQFFKGKWRSVGYQFNALKTMRYWHPDMWDDGSVCCLHYIVDKPWAARVGEDGVAGYKGKDGVTHRWWWEEFEKWEKDRESEKELIETVRQHVAGKDGGSREELRALGSQAQAFAKNKGTEEPEQRTHGPVLRKKMLGERGHGPVVRNPGEAANNERTLWTNSPQEDAGGKRSRPGSTSSEGPRAD
ncbi:glycosyltransferase family 8 protein [Glonium stellatum]|uniref:Glycosyltransferase family 8 protein n=1 Tax=Glonium stellatum TaxID=574774 RepID=A0A8E2EXI1_9PEZI|nr:glycosyltransferase family 8 protein [Glonium stellatum]